MSDNILEFQTSSEQIEDYKVGHFFIAEVSCFAVSTLTQLLWQKDVSGFVFKDRVIKHQEQRKENDTGKALKQSILPIYAPKFEKN